MKPRDEVYDGRYANPPRSAEKRRGYFKIVEAWETSWKQSHGQGGAHHVGCHDLIAVLSPYLSTAEHEILCAHVLKTDDKSALSSELTRRFEIILDRRHDGKVKDKFKPSHREREHRSH